MDLGRLIDRILLPFSPSTVAAREQSRLRLGLGRAVAASQGMYRGADISRLLGAWGLGQDTSTTPSWEREALRQRSRDLARNDPAAAGVVETMGLNVVGSGLSPQSRIRAEALGISEDQADELMIQCERAWSDWAPWADAADTLSFDDIQLLVMTKLVEDGEIFVLPGWQDAAWRPFGRCLELAESERVGGSSLLSSAEDTGIVTGSRGEPLSYRIRKAGSKGLNGDADYVTVPRRDADGRPLVLHVYPVSRVGQLRGVPRFAPVISAFKHLADYMEAEVVSARIAAILSVFITHADPEGARYANSDGEDEDGKRVEDLKPGMVNYLRPGEGVTQVAGVRPGGGFDPFITGVLRFISMGLGLPYELVTKDFSKTNYSSARAALLEGRRLFTRWRSWLAAKLCQPVYELVIEEAWARGRIDVPDFRAVRTEICRAQWIGGGWGWVDPTKEVEASRMAVDSGFSTLAEECAAQGRDYEEVLWQRRRENALARKLGVTITLSTTSKASPPGDNSQGGANTSDQGGDGDAA
jgi:lambda family phage portal protein